MKRAAGAGSGIVPLELAHDRLGRHPARQQRARVGQHRADVVAGARARSARAARSRARVSSGTPELGQVQPRQVGAAADASPCTRRGASPISMQRSQQLDRALALTERDRGARLLEHEVGETRESARAPLRRARARRAGARTPAAPSPGGSPAPARTCAVAVRGSPPSSSHERSNSASAAASSPAAACSQPRL